jgi:hypothetical protein
MYIVAGNYVTAEQGGGLSGFDRQDVLVINRTVPNGWEDFAIEANNDGTISLRIGQYYVTAEDGGGGVLSTNRTTKGPWETFLDIDGKLRCYDDIHFIRARTDLTLAADGSEAQGLTFCGIVVQPPVDLKKWKGAFCIPDALPGIPYGDERRIWTPAYGTYSDKWREAIRDAYRARGYTHFVYNCAGLPYANDYPELADDPDRVARDLSELLAAGLVPVVVATDDRSPDTILQSFRQNSHLIPICFPCWEMNGPLNNDEDRQKRLIDATIAAAPDADCYLHFTPGHGSISYTSEVGGWRWCQEHGTTGLLAQGSNQFPPEPPVSGGQGLESTCVRLLGMVGGWEGLSQLTVKFEYGIWQVYHGGVSEADQRDYTTQFLTNCPHAAGYCDGGY